MRTVVFFIPSVKVGASVIILTMEPKVEKINTGIEHPGNEKIEAPTIQALAAAFGFSELEVIGVSEHGISSYNLILRTGDGRQLFLKQYNESHHETRHTTNQIEQYVAENTEVPVVLPLKTESGDSQVFVDGKMYALFDYISNHEAPPATEEDEQLRAYSLAKTLGIIHATPINIEVTDGDTVDKPPTTIEGRVANLEKIKEIVLAKDTFDDFDRQALKAIEQKQIMLLEFKDDSSPPSNQGICHGDYHGKNVLFDEQMNVLGVCDWDNASISDTYKDFLNSFIMCAIGRRFETYQTKRQLVAKEFMKGYLDGNNKEIDLNSLKRALSIICQEKVGTSWPMYQHYLHNHTKADGALDYSLKNATFFSQNQEEVLEFILNALPDQE